MNPAPDHPLHQIADTLPEVLWLRDPPTGAFRYCSAGSESIWGRSPEHLLQHADSWRSAILPEDRLEVEMAWARALQEGQFDCEYRVRFADGTIKWIHDRGSLTPGDGGTAVQLAGLAQDVTAHKQLETEVRKAYDALHSSVNGILITDTQGRITYANPALLALLRFASATEAIGRPAEEIFVRDDIRELSDVSAEIATSGSQTREFTVQRADGSQVIVLVASSAVHDQRGEVVGRMASFAEVTALKQRDLEIRNNHLRLVRLTERMVTLEERERRRISSQLHDTAVQSLALANIRLGAVSQALAKAGLDTARRQLEAAREMLADGIRQCRLVMADLTPPLLYEVGVGVALKQFAEHTQRLQGVRILVEEATPNLEVPDSLRGLLFQTARELVLNACKHARPSTIRIQLAGSHQDIQLSVLDDGRGFDASAPVEKTPNDTSGFGLFSIRQRISQLGGTFVIQGQAGSGTEVRVLIPLPQTT